MRAYRARIKSMRRLRTDHDFWHSVVKSPARRFWVSPDRAHAVLSEIAKGATLAPMNPTRRAMYLEIHRRVALLRRDCPRLSLIRAVEKVVFAQAPEFYLTPGTAKVLISKHKKMCRERHEK